MPTPLFRLDLTRHLDPVLQLARAQPDRVQLVAWTVRYLAENTAMIGRLRTALDTECLGCGSVQR
jgi:hypothetical protein